MSPSTSRGRPGGPGPATPRTTRRGTPCAAPLGTPLAAALSLSLAFALALACASSAPSDDALEVRDPWIRAVPPVAPMTAGYLRVENHGSTDDALVGASSPQASAVELHETVTRGDRVSMEARERLPLPAGGLLVLEPGGAHLMLRGYRPPADGVVELELRFESGRRRAVRAPVERR